MLRRWTLTIPDAILPLKFQHFTRWPQRSANVLQQIAQYFSRRQGFNRRQMLPTSPANWIPARPRSDAVGSLSKPVTNWLLRRRPTS